VQRIADNDVVDDVIMITPACDPPGGTVLYRLRGHLATTTNVIVVVTALLAMTSRHIVAGHTNSTAGVAGNMFCLCTFMS